MFWRRRKTEPRFFYVDVIWGQTYAQLYANVSLATRLSPRNLPAMPNNAVSKTIIVTTDEDRDLIRQASLFRKLESLMEVEFLPLQIIPQPKYDLMSSGHQLAIEHVRNQGYCVFFAPDAIIADGAILRLYELAKMGRQIVSGFGPNVNQSAFLRAISRDPAVDTGRVLTLAPRQLTALIMQHLHENHSRFNARSKTYPRHAALCMWDGPNGDGLLIRAMCLHPYLFDTRLATPALDLYHATLDWWLVPRAIRDPNSYYVVTDADDFCLCGVLPESAREASVPNEFSAALLAHDLVETSCPYLNRNNFLYGVKYHTKDLDEAWARLEKETYDVALDVIDPGRLLKSYLAPAAPITP